MAPLFEDRSIRRRALFALIVAATVVASIEAASVPTAKPEDAGFSSARLSAVHDTIQRHIDAGDITGAVTLVASRGRIVHFEAHGLMDLASKRPMAKDSLFRIMSMTKPVTAVAVMMMEEAGKLSVTDPVAKYLPEFKQLTVSTSSPQRAGNGPPAASGPTVPASREITISDLLTHTSGMPGTAPERKPDDTLATIVHGYAARPLHFQPGTDWEYSGIAGPDILARIVEIVSGQDYEQFLKTRIFGPLGMKETSHFPTEAQRPRVVTLYTRTPNGFVPTENADRYSSTTYFSGSAGLVSTAEDYLQLAQMLCNGGELNGTRLLKPETVRRIATNYVGDSFNGKLNFPKRGFGFGYLNAIVQDHAAAGWALPDGSFGWFGAYGSQVWINPQERLVTLLMIQNLDYQVQRDFEAAVVQAREADAAPSSAQQTISGSPGAQQPARGQSQRQLPTDPKVPTTVSTNLPGHPSPPQPQQQQGLEYFEGTWAFSWLGRESPITAGPRSGTATFTRIGHSNFLDMQSNGKVDGGPAYKESAVMAWSPDKKVLVVNEKTASSTEILSTGDWSSPIGIRFDVEPLRVQGKLLKLRRSYAIVSATSFSVTEELSTDDGPFVRLGVGTFEKKK